MKLKSTYSLKNIYDNVNKYEKVDNIELDKLNENNFKSLVTLKERVKKVGRINKKLKQKMEQFNILE